MVLSCSQVWKHSSWHSSHSVLTAVMKAGQGLLKAKSSNSWAEKQSTGCGFWRVMARSTLQGWCKRLGVRGPDLLPQSYSAVTSRNAKMRTADNAASAASAASGPSPNFPHITF